MAHNHPVHDTDTHFIIDPFTKLIINASGKTKLMKGSHNSEVFAFDMPRFVEGHDMMLCNVVEVHYNNISIDGAEQHPNMYEVTDLKIHPDDEEMVTLSWTISGNATQLVGILPFMIRFACVADDGTVEYNWPTDSYNDMQISDTMNNAPVVVELYADIIHQWKQDIVEAAVAGAAEAQAKAEEAQQKAEQARGAAETAQTGAEQAATNAAQSEQNAATSEANAKESEQKVHDAETVVVQAEEITMNAKEVAEKAARQAELSKQGARQAQSGAENAARNAADASVSASADAQLAMELQLSAKNFAEKAANSATAAENIKDEVEAIAEEVELDYQRARAYADSANASVQYADYAKGRCAESEANAAKSAEEAKNAANSVNFPKPTPEVAGKALIVDEAGDGFEFGDASGGATSWEDLGSTFEEGVVLAECTPEGAEGEFYLPDVISLTVGNEYTVNWNGTQHKCVAQDIAVFMPGAVALGDIGVLTTGEPTTGEPFMIIAVPTDLVETMGGIGVAIMPIDGSESITLSITEFAEVVHQIPSKYVPFSDWNASEGEDGHVLNRTHYEETVVVNFPETEVPVGSTITPFMYRIPIVAGGTYTVTWNGTEYQCIAIEHVVGMVLGNTGMLGGGANTGEPFLLILKNERQEDGSFGFIVCTDGSTTATLSIKGENKVIHKLSGKYVDVDIMGSLETIDLLLTRPVTFTLGASGDLATSLVLESLKKGFIKVSFELSHNGTTEQVTVLMVASGVEKDSTAYSAFGTLDIDTEMLFVRLNADEGGDTTVIVYPAYTRKTRNGFVDYQMWPVVLGVGGQKCYGIIADENGTLQTYEI